MPDDNQNTVNNDSAVNGAFPPDVPVAPPSDFFPPASPKPTRPQVNGKVISTFLGMLLLVGGLGAGVVLVGQQQRVEPLAYNIEPAPINSCNLKDAMGKTYCATIQGACQKYDALAYPVVQNPGVVSNCNTGDLDLTKAGSLASAGGQCLTTTGSYFWKTCSSYAPLVVAKCCLNMNTYNSSQDGGSISNTYNVLDIKASPSMVIQAATVTVKLTCKSNQTDQCINTYNWGNDSGYQHWRDKVASDPTRYAFTEAPPRKSAKTCQYLTGMDNWGKFTYAPNSYFCP